MIQIVEIENPFEPNKKKITEIVYTGKEISVYVETENRDIYLNGHKVDEPDKTIPLDGSQIIVTPHIAGKGLRSILGVVAMIALSVYSGNVAIGKAALFGMTHLSAASMLASGAIMLIGGKIINAVFPQQQANLNYDEQQQSQSYGWDIPTPSTAAGGIVGETYGECIPAAQLLEQHVETVGDEQYLNLLYCGGYGPVDSIDNIRIEYTDISNFDGVQLETRLGTNDQKPISFFKNTPLDQSVGVQLKEGEGVIRTSDSTKATGLEVTLEFAGGLFHVNDKGNYENCTAKFKLEYRKGKSDSWHNFDKNNRNRTFDITAATNSEVRRTFSVSGLDAGQYDVRVTATQRPHGSRDQSLVNWSILTSFLDGVYCRPNKVLVAMRIKASSQLSSGVPSVNWRQTRKYVWVHNPNTNQYEQKAADNPIWACYDILHGARRLKNINTGAYEFAVYGYPSASLDAYYEQWKSAADYADEEIVNQDGEKEPRFRFDAFFDTNEKRWNAAQKAANVGHAAIIPHGRNIGITVDRPGHITQIFGEGRTTMSSFKGSFSAKEDRAKAIEVTYNDAQNDFKNTVMTIRSPNYNLDESSDNTAQLSLFGVKRRSQAYREAVTAIATNERQLQFVDFDADIDAIVAEYGDIIGINHTVARIGIASGRVVAVSGNEVTIDKEVELDASKKYEIYFTLSNDALIKREVAASNGKTNVLRIATPFDDQQVPQKYDNYAFGEVNKAVKPFRIINATMKDDLTVSIKAAEYDDAMYSTEVDYERYPVIDYTNKPMVAQIIGLSASEQSYVADHTTIADIDVNWQLENKGMAPDNFIVDVQSRNSDYHERFSTHFTSQKVRNVHRGENYTITVYCVYDGITLSHVTTEIFVHGTSYTQNNATNLIVTQNGKGFTLSWTPAYSSDIIGYNVYQGSGGADITDCRLVSASQHDTVYYAPLTSTQEAVYQFYIKCVGRDGQETGDALTGVGQVTLPSAVTGAKATTVYRQYKNGSTGYDVIVTFILPKSPGVKKAAVWYKTNQAPLSHLSDRLGKGVKLSEAGFYTEWQYAGDGENCVIIPAAKVGDTYRIKILAVNVDGLMSPESDAVYLTIAVNPKTTVPNKPNNFHKEFRYNSMMFMWDDVTNSDVDFYELRYDQNPGAEANLIARVQGASVIMTSLSKREATIYLYAHNATKMYSYPATLKYNYPILDAPTGITIEKSILAVNITVPRPADGANGTKLYIDKTVIDIGTGTHYQYANKAGIYAVSAAYYDVFGEGHRSATYYATIDPYIDPKYIENESLTREMMDKTINTAVDNAGTAITRLNGVDNSLNNINDEINGIHQTTNSITSTVKSNKETQDKINASQATTNTATASQIKQNSDNITAVITNLNGADPSKSVYKSITQLQANINGVSSTVSANKNATDTAISSVNQKADTISSTVQEQKETTDKQIDGLSSQIKQNANSITSVVTNLKDKDKAVANYSAIAQLESGISSKVEKTDYNGEKIASMVNQSASTVAIEAEHLHVTAQTQIDGDVITSGMIKANAITARELSADVIALADSQGIQGGTAILDKDGLTVNNTLDGSSVLFGQNGMEFVNKNNIHYSMVGATLSGTANDGQYIRFTDGEGNAAPWQSAPTVITMFREAQANHPDYSTSQIRIHCYADEITQNGFRIHVYSGIANGTGSHSQYQYCGYASWTVGRYQFRMQRPIGSWQTMNFSVAMPSNASRVQFVGHFSVKRHYRDAEVCLHGAGHKAIESQRLVVKCNGVEKYNGVIIDDSQGNTGEDGGKYYCGLNTNKDSWTTTSVSSVVIPVTGGCNLDCTLSLNPVTMHPGDKEDPLEIKFYIDSINLWVDGEQKLSSGRAAFLVLDAKNSGYYKTED